MMTSSINTVKQQQQQTSLVLNHISFLLYLQISKLFNLGYNCIILLIPTKLMM